MKAKKSLSEIFRKLNNNYTQGWLLRLEMLEILKDLQEGSDIRLILIEDLGQINEQSEENKSWLMRG